MIVHQIKETNPDIIGVQEARYDPYFGLCCFEKKITQFIDDLN